MPTRARGRLALVPILVALVLCSLAPVLYGAQRSVWAQGASLIDCDEVIDQAEAQRFFEVKGAPTYDSLFLNGDNEHLTSAE
jgi:hypothetical protein